MGKPKPPLPKLVSCPKGPVLRKGPYKGKRKGHLWKIPPPDGTPPIGRCSRRGCGAKCEFVNSIPVRTWNNRAGDAHLRSAQATKAANKRRLAEKWR